MLIKQLITSKETRLSAHGKTFVYDINEYPFRDALEKLFGIQLNELHNWLGDFDKFERKNDQQTIVHRVFYSNFKDNVELIYKNFVRKLGAKELSDLNPDEIKVKLDQILDWNDNSDKP